MWSPSCPSVSTVRQQLEPEWKVYADVNTDPVPNATMWHPPPSSHFGDLMPDRLSGNSPLMQAFQTYEHISVRTFEIFSSEILGTSQMHFGQGHNSYEAIKRPFIPLELKKYINIVYIINNFFFPLWKLLL